MKWTKKQLIPLADKELEFEERLTFDKNDFRTFDRLNDLKDITVSGVGYFSKVTQHFHVDYAVEGIMIVPCAVSLEDVEVPFEVEAEDEFSFEPCDDEDVIEVKKEIVDLNPLVFQLILSQVPLKVVKEGVTYPKGNGWEVIKEEDYLKSKRNEIDPRLAKLKEFKIEDK